MTQAYFDPSRVDDAYSLPDCEVFYVSTRRGGLAAMEPGWYWQACLPGCLPDSDPVGPFATEQEALDDAQQGAAEGGDS